MDKEKDDVFREFTRKAMKRLKEKRVRKYETLHVPSLDGNIRIQNLNYEEIMECTEIDDSRDPNRSDKYAIYLAVVEPDLKKAAMELKEKGEIRECVEIVDMFEYGEITDLATEIMRFSGVLGSRKVTVVEELKNS